MMKLSKETLEVIKNFATINTNFVITPGNKISSCTTLNNLLAEAVVQEDFPMEFGIYNLTEFLGVVSLFSDPDFMFKEHCVEISQGKNKIIYYKSEPSLLHRPPGKLNFPGSDVEFDITKDQVLSIIKASAALTASDVVINSSGSDITICVRNNDNDTSNSFSFYVGDSPLTFNLIIKIDRFKMIPDDYKIELSKKKYAKFSSKNRDLVYYVSSEKNSTFE